MILPLDSTASAPVCRRRFSLGLTLLKRVGQELGRDGEEKHWGRELHGKGDSETVKT